MGPPQNLNFLVFQFILGHIGDLDDGIGVLQLGRDAVEHLHDLVKRARLQYLWPHNVQNCQTHPKQYFTSL